MENNTVAAGTLPPHSDLQRLERQRGRLAEWVRSMLTRRHCNLVACALANKLARTAWVIAAHHTECAVHAT